MNLGQMGSHFCCFGVISPFTGSGFQDEFCKYLASPSKTIGRKFKQILYLLSSKICECAVCICMETESTHISFETADKKKEHGSMLL